MFSSALVIGISRTRAIVHTLVLRVLYTLEKCFCYPRARQARLLCAPLIEKLVGSTWSTTYQFPKEERNSEHNVLLPTYGAGTCTTDRLYGFPTDPEFRRLE
jgi:hypothetical protein